ncbi:CDP-alcohol phosphatidyltransferase family protein [Aneurinibacillus aneurinilyticus]|uniref:CDP-alcohol phosphatidyltransferase family protein n=1 Tax=Aneurinibacillus aneurinilyticus TaxID=1391 RepID=UPI00366C3212
MSRIFRLAPNRNPSPPYSLRSLRKGTSFGKLLKKELDSLTDIISFGVAPAMIMYAAVFYDLHTIGVLIVSLFPICGALRLAYLRTQSSSKKNVTGLPIGMANGILAAFILIGPVLNKDVSMIVIIVLSYFMVSKIKFFRVNNR